MNILLAIALLIPLYTFEATVTVRDGACGKYPTHQGQVVFQTNAKGGGGGPKHNVVFSRFYGYETVFLTHQETDFSIPVWVSDIIGYEQLLDEDGNPVFDEDGNPVPDLTKPIYGPPYVTYPYMKTVFDGYQFNERVQQYGVSEIGRDGKASVCFTDFNYTVLYYVGQPVATVPTVGRYEAWVAAYGDWSTPLSPVVNQTISVPEVR